MHVAAVSQRSCCSDAFGWGWKKAAVPWLWNIYLTKCNFKGCSQRTINCEVKIRHIRPIPTGFMCTAVMRPAYPACRVITRSNNGCWIWKHLWLNDPTHNNSVQQRSKLPRKNFSEPKFKKLSSQSYYFQPKANANRGNWSAESRDEVTPSETQRAPAWRGTQVLLLPLDDLVWQTRARRWNMSRGGSRKDLFLLKDKSQVHKIGRGVR